MSARASRALVHALLRRMRTGTLTVCEAGARRSFGAGAPRATLQVNSPRAWRAFVRGSRGLADSYERGEWDTPDLVALVRVAALNAPALDRARRRFAPLLGPARLVGGAFARSTRARRRRDIGAHYDLGNELFEHMLDPTLTYSCAVFEAGLHTLEQAQVAKLERICERLAIGPHDRVLEIGTGWGAFALYAAATRGCEVTTTTISREQHEYACARVRESGLEDRVTVLAEDFSDLRGRYDKLVSIEMIEAVGWRLFPRFFAKCSELLEANGAMFLQAITIDDRAYEVEKASRSFINTRIFPGGCLPSLEVIGRDLARFTDMQVIHLEDITPHYVETLRRWRLRFTARARELEALGYDERFRRLWTLYLAYCEGGFAERRIRDVQLLLAKPRWREGVRAPWLHSARALQAPPSPAGAPRAPLHPA